MTPGALTPLSQQTFSETIRLSVPGSIPQRVAGLLDCIIFYGLVLLLPLVAVPYGTVTPGWEAVFECTVFGLGCLWVIEGLLSHSWQLKGFPLLLPLLALVVLALFQTITLRGRGPV